MPPWYAKAEDWMQAQGWATMLIIAGIIVGVTFWLIWQGQAIPLAAWLTYLLMP